MARLLRVKCACGNVMNAAPGNICPKCKRMLEFPPDAVIYIYRKGSPIGIAGGFGIYINGLTDTFVDIQKFYDIAVIYVESLEKAIEELTNT